MSSCLTPDEEARLRSIPPCDLSSEIQLQRVIIYRYMGLVYPGIIAAGLTPASLDLLTGCMLTLSSFWARLCVLVSMQARFEDSCPPSDQEDQPDLLAPCDSFPVYCLDQPCSWLESPPPGIPISVPFSADSVRNTSPPLHISDRISFPQFQLVEAAA